jgi:xanthine dehydrogenase accessory factor
VKEILSDVERWEEDGESVVVATVVATRRSAPRPLGSSFAVSSSGALCGSVSGGCVESDVYEKAQEVFASGAPQLVTYGISDDEAWSVGLPCGGEIDVFLQRRGADEPLAPPEGERAILFTVLEGEHAGTKLLVGENGEATGDAPGALAELAEELLRRGRNRLLEVDGSRVFAEWYGPPPRLLVYGAVDTAEAMCAAAKRGRSSRRASASPRPTSWSSAGRTRSSRRSRRTTTRRSSCSRTTTSSTSPP